MTHWTEKYIGLNYDDQSNNCAQLVGLVQREQFGRLLDLPHEFPTDVFAQSAMFQNLIEDYAVPTDSPTEGDMVLTLGRRRLWHGGVLQSAP